jgi:competence protein ComEA
MPAFTLSRRHALVAVACVAMLVLVASRLVAPSRPAPDSASLSPIVTVPATSPPRSVIVDVAGAVRTPGVYSLRTDARVADAIARAGGMTRRADRAAVNLAAPVADGVQILVPSLAGGRGGGSLASAGVPAGPVNLNSASLEQLDALPGIGPITAQKILDYRRDHGPFTSVDQLDAIPGIGPSRIEDLRGEVVP